MLNIIKYYQVALLLLSHRYKLLGLNLFLIGRLHQQSCHVTNQLGAHSLIN